jgi:hypothetical protein
MFDDKKTTDDIIFENYVETGTNLTLLKFSLVGSSKELGGWNLMIDNVP